jgi:hypothetical protein
VSSLLQARYDLNLWKLINFIDFRDRFPHNLLILMMLFEWHDIHKEELLENWQLAKDRKPLRKIMPLP